MIKLEAGQFQEANKATTPQGHRDKWNEYTWPVASLISARPLQFLLNRFVYNIHEGQKVLELGSGYPFYKFYSSQVGSNGLFLALDINQMIQKRAKNISSWVDRVLSKSQQGSREAQVVANGSSLPFQDNTFDLVVANNYTGQIENVNQVYRVLKPGGRFINSFTGILGVPVGPVFDKKLYKKAGFENIRLFPGAPSLILINWNWYLVASKPETIFSPSEPI